MESLQDNHEKGVFKGFYHSSFSISISYLPSSFNRGKGNRKALIRTTKKWPRLLNRVFHLKHFTDNNFGT